MDELSIKLKIGNREYPMRIKSQDEESIRKAGKILNDKIRDYRNQFIIDDPQDLLAMVAFDCMIERMKNEEKSTGLYQNSKSRIINLVSRISEVL